MPKNYPDIWVGRVERNIDAATAAPFLDGIAELPQPVTVMGEGSTSEQNLVCLPTTDFEPDVLINNTAYPIAVQAYQDDTVTIALDKFQTKGTSVSDDQIIGSSYDQIDAVTKSHTEAINKNKYMKAIHSIAPQKDDKKTAVIETTGNDDGNGRKMLRREDIIAMKKRFDKMSCPIDGRRLVLCADHVADLLEKDQKFADQYYNYTSGKISNLYGFQVYEYIANPHYAAATKEKMNFGAIPTDKDYQASVAFYAPNVVKKTGKTKQYFSPASGDPTNQTNILNYRHYFIAVPKRAQLLGAIISANI